MVFRRVREKRDPTKKKVKVKAEPMAMPTTGTTEEPAGGGAKGGGLGGGGDGGGGLGGGGVGGGLGGGGDGGGDGGRSWPVAVMCGCAFQPSASRMQRICVSSWSSMVITTC